MSKTIVDYELPFGRPNGAALRAGLASAFGLDESDISLEYNRDHPNAHSPTHVVGIVFDVDASTVTQTNVDTATDELKTLLGVNARELGWGSYDPDYLDA